MREKYKSAFRNVAPSETSVERILNMTKKKKKVCFKPLIVAAVIITLALASIISVNAATDGAVVEKVEAVVNEVKVFINGEEKIRFDVKYENRSDGKDNQKADLFGFGIDDDLYVEFDEENNGASIDENGETQLNLPIRRASEK